MTAYVIRSRRMLLRDMGKAGLAVMILGTAACASEAGQGSGMEDDTRSTTGINGTSDTVSGSPTTDTRLEWHRVNLGFVSAYLLYRNGEAALVDTGVAGSEGAIEQALREIGLQWGDVGHLILTHKHPDHQGSVQAVLGQVEDAPWYAGAGDIDLIETSRPGQVVRDGDSVFDLEVIETPGHTPGHISLLDPAGGVLVSGDAINGANGGVIGANPEFTEDMDLANVSIRKLAEFDYEVVLFGHGEPVLGGASEAVRELAATL